MNGSFPDLSAWLQGVLYLSLGLLAIPALVPALYLLRLTWNSATPARLSNASRSVADTKWRFDIIVPAHDEATGIAEVVKSLQRLDWPREAFRILVVADNCSDMTAANASKAGACVLERHHPELRGKGHALQFGFDYCLSHAGAQAFVVVDADSRVSRNLLRAFAERLASGSEVAQVYHGVLHPNHDSRHRLMAIAYSAFHRIRSRGRERLGLSCGIRGNGWCITRRTLQQVPYSAHGLAEDIEYGLKLGMAGVRVEYIDEAQVFSSMATDAIGIVSQRHRWEEGRSSLPRLFTLPLLSPWPHSTRALRRDLGIDLLVPPLATIALAVGLLVAVGATARWALPGSPAPAVFLAFGMAAGLALSVHVVRAWQLSGTGKRGLLELALAPRFALWKLALRFRPKGAAGWVRTRRLTR